MQYLSQGFLSTDMLGLLIWDFFKPALAGGFSLESEWQQVS